MNVIDFRILFPFLVTASSVHLRLLTSSKIGSTVGLMLMSVSLEKNKRDQGVRNKSFSDNFANILNE